MLKESMGTQNDKAQKGLNREFRQVVNAHKTARDVTGVALEDVNKVVQNKHLLYYITKDDSNDSSYGIALEEYVQNETNPVDVSSFHYVKDRNNQSYAEHVVKHFVLHDSLIVPSVTNSITKIEEIVEKFASSCTFPSSVLELLSENDVICDSSDKRAVSTAN